MQIYCVMELFRYINFIFKFYIKLEKDSLKEIKANSLD